MADKEKRSLREFLRHINDYTYRFDPERGRFRYRELRGVRDTYGAEGSESRALAQWTGCRILCLDDIGKEKPTADALEKLFALLDARYRSGKPMLFTTQYRSPMELGHRLMESGGDKPTAQAIVRRVFGGGDYQAEVVRC